MFNKKITRKEFLRMGFFGILSIFTLPFFKRFSPKEGASLKEARYYKNLAG